MKTIGIVLVILGLVALVYGGIGYNRDRTVLEVGGMKATATEHRTIAVPAIAGVILLVGGIALVVAEKRRA
jgi:uncharacterized membrane protein YidH (DUF202 family)